MFPTKIITIARDMSPENRAFFIIYNHLSSFTSNLLAAGISLI